MNSLAPSRPIIKQKAKKDLYTFWITQRLVKPNPTEAKSLTGYNSGECSPAV
jgi:hypothetical protein